MQMLKNERGIFEGLREGTKDKRYENFHDSDRVSTFSYVNDLIASSGPYTLSWSYAW